MPAQLPEFAQRLRTLRERSQLSVRELAKLSGVSSSAISHYENGHRRPKAPTTAKLASALRVDPEDIDPYLPYELPGEPCTIGEPPCHYHTCPDDPDFHRLAAIWPSLEESDRLELLAQALRLKKGLSPSAAADDSASTLSA